jgi:hypothetical protein
MDRIEAEFRRVESILDELLEQAGEPLRVAGLRVVDHSGRTYHYKNDYLFWSHAFVKEWPVDPERARVTAYLDYAEPMRLEEPPRVRLSWRAELFQQGQTSSVDERGESVLSLDDLQRRGIGAAVVEAVAEGAARLPP